ncbi:MAG: PilZ domain-containing protein, partial [Bdellovibrionales bacterium]|nr:PilZ domain-containing protein [Bdellovibrionales bacterium]
MNKRPLIFFILSIVFLGIALSFPFQAAWVYGEGLWDVANNIEMISFLNVLVMIALVAHIPLFLRASRWLILTLPATVVLVAWNNYVVGAMDMGASLPWIVSATAGFIALSGSLLAPSPRRLLLNPSLRWWLQKRRAKVVMPVEIKGCRFDLDHLKTFDLSTSGAYLTGFSDADWERTPEVGKVFDLSLALSPLLKIKCEAKLVRVSEKGTDSYPRGIGIQFVDLKRRDQQKMDRYLKTEFDLHPRNQTEPT